jgi:hypothetical protein
MVQKFNGMFDSHALGSADSRAPHRKQIGNQAPLVSHNATPAKVSGSVAATVCEFFSLFSAVPLTLF